MPYFAQTSPRGAAENQAALVRSSQFTASPNAVHLRPHLTILMSEASLDPYHPDPLPASGRAAQVGIQIPLVLGLHVNLKLQDLIAQRLDALQFGALAQNQRAILHG